MKVLKWSDNVDQLKRAHTTSKQADKMDSTILNMEQERIVSYLYAYGNTRETDLITYGVQRLGKSEDSMREVVDKIVLYGRLERIMHKELSPAVTYVKPRSMVSIELEL